MDTKAGEKDFLKLYIGLSSCHLTSTGRLAHSFGLHKYGSLARPSKGQCTISKILFSLIFSLFIEKNIFLSNTCFVYSFSEPKFMVCPILFDNLGTFHHTSTNNHMEYSKLLDKRTPWNVFQNQ